MASHVPRPPRHRANSNTEPRPVSGVGKKPSLSALRTNLRDKDKDTSASDSTASRSNSKPRLRRNSRSPEGLKEFSSLTAEEKEQLQRAAWDRADCNGDGVLEATEIKLIHEACNLDVTDEDIWFRMAAAHEALRKQQLDNPEGKPSGEMDAWIQARVASKRDLMAVRYDHYLAYPALLPEEWLDSTLKLHREGDTATVVPAPTPPQPRKGSGKRRKARAAARDQVKRFSYAPAAEDLTLRHAVIIAIDHYADDRIQDNSHCVNDARMLGKVLEALNYSVELVVNDMDRGRQPTKQAILDTLSCDRGMDSLLVVFFGYWVTAPLQLRGRVGAPLTHFALCYDTSLEFTASNVLTLDEVKAATVTAAMEWETVIIIDGLQPGYIQGCRGEGYSIISYMDQDVYTPSQLKYRSLLAPYMEKGLRGAAQADSGEPLITLASLHRYLAKKISKHTYGGIPNISDDADDHLLATQILHSHNADSHPRQTLQSRPTKFQVDCAFAEDVHPDDFQTLFMDAIRDSEQAQQIHRLQVIGVKSCKTTEFLLNCPIADIKSAQHMLKLKQDIEKFADENPWVQMRTAESAGDGGVAWGSSLSWTLSVGMGLDNNSPATLLTIQTGSQESVCKLREKYLNKRLREWANFPILRMRQRVRIECAGTEYDLKKLDVMGRIGTFYNEEKKGQARDAEPKLPKIYIYTVQELQDAPWRPRPLPLRRFNLLSEDQFQRLCEGLPMLIFWCGKAENPSATITPGQQMVMNGLRDICSDVDFNNKIRFFMYEVDVVMYPPYVQQALAKFRPRQPEDEVVIVYLKYDRAVTLDINNSHVRVSAEKLRAFCNGFLQGRAKRLHDGTLRGLRPVDMPEEHPGLAVVGINHFDRMAMNIEDDVLVLYWNPDYLQHQREKLARAVNTFVRLGKLFSEQPEELRHPKLVIMSDDNNERFFFPEHHADATTSVTGMQEQAKAQEAGHQPPRGGAGATPASPASTASPAGSTYEPSTPTLPESPKSKVLKPPYTIRCFLRNEPACDKVRRGEFLDYWPEVFETAVQKCKTFYAAASSPQNLSDWLERNTEWAPRVPLRVAMGQDIQDHREEEKLPDIFSGFH